MKYFWYFCILRIALTFLGMYFYQIHATRYPRYLGSALSKNICIMYITNESWAAIHPPEWWKWIDCWNFEMQHFVATMNHSSSPASFFLRAFLKRKDIPKKSLFFCDFKPNIDFVPHKKNDSIRNSIFPSFNCSEFRIEFHSYLFSSTFITILNPFFGCDSIKIGR